MRSEDGQEEIKQMSKELDEKTEKIKNMTKYIARLANQHEDKSAKVI